MSKKEKFIEEIEMMIENVRKTTGENPLSEDAAVYFEALKGAADKEKPAFTENGKLVLQFMKDNKDKYNNMFKAKEIGEELNITSRTASGATRKLVTDGYVEKIGESPVVYSLTEKGISVNFEE